MTEYRIIVKRVVRDIWGDDYDEYTQYAGFRNLGTQGELFEKPKTSWKPLFSFRSRHDYIGHELTRILEQLAKEGFSAKDIITSEYKKRYLHEEQREIKTVYICQEPEKIKPSDSFYRDENLEGMIKELASKKA
ncbi:hypothetical protein J4423_03610 [Candidatus Pacearchaeota archaeon]|nr:hypothetical protein [Candidatus Pacearchaeota archaeon]